MTEGLTELLMLLPLSLAAGIDLYLTLLFIGAAPTTQLWSLPLPGALGDLEPPGVLLMVGAFYLAELAAERFPLSGLIWNGLHAVIRPVSGALLALLLLDAQPLPVALLGSVAGGLLASYAHAVRTGARILHRFAEREGPSPLLLSFAEDALVLGVVTATLDLPVWAFGGALIALAIVAPFSPSLVRAFAYAVHLTVARVFRTLGLRRWRRADELPDWIGSALRDDEEALGRWDALRGYPVGGWRLEGAPRFAAGWVVVGGGAPRFVFRRRKGTAVVLLPARAADSVRDRDLYRRIELKSSGGTAVMLVGWSGPSTESLAAEFMPE